MEDKREVSLDRVEAFKREKGIHFHFETSAKTGENIESLFITASKILYHNFKDKIAQMVSLLLFYSILLYLKQKDEALKKRKDKKAKNKHKLTANTTDSQSAGEGKKKVKCCK